MWKILFSIPPKAGEWYALTLNPFNTSLARVVEVDKCGYVLYKKYLVKKTEEHLLDIQIDRELHSSSVSDFYYGYSYKVDKTFLEKVKLL